MILAEKLKAMRKEQGISQVALCEKIGVSTSLYNKYEKKNVRPPYETIMRIADYYGVPIESLLDDEQSVANIVNKYSNAYAAEPHTTLPVLGIIRAGQPICTEQGEYETAYADAKWGDGNHFMLKVLGDSMYPTIVDGAFAIIRKQDMADAGDIVAFALDGEYATLKRYYPQPDGTILLKGDNPKAFEYKISPEQLANGDAHFLGVCVSVKQDFHPRKY